MIRALFCARMKIVCKLHARNDLLATRTDARIVQLATFARKAKKNPLPWWALSGSWRVREGPVRLAGRSTAEDRSG